MLKENNITPNKDTIITFSDSYWNDCVDTGRSTGGNISIMQGGPVDHSSHLPVLVAMSSGEAEYISAAAAACMRASHLRMSAICMANCNKDTAGNRHVARRFHYVRQGTALKEHKFEWIGTKFQLADILTKVGNKSSFQYLWSLILHDDE